MLHKDYDRNISVEKISGRDPQGAWRQDDVISGNSRKVILTLTRGVSGSCETVANR
jgi:hypothetical protein